MRFVEVEEVPRRNAKKHLQGYLQEFMNMNIKVAKLDFNEREYKSPSIARSVIAIAIKKSGLPSTITKRGDEIYLIRNDM